MHIRRATPRDFSTTATFSVPAFIHDELYRFTNPFAARYPEDFRQYYLRKHKQRNALPGYVFSVAILDPADQAEEHAPKQKAAQVDEAQQRNDGEDKIVGYAIWRRYGESEQAKSWQSQTWAEWFESSLLQLEERYVSFFGLDRSFSASQTRSLGAMGFFRDDFGAIPERWHLHNLCVDPAYQRRGIGAKLLSWGLEQAAKEKVGVTLQTSTAGELLYRHMGFKTWMERDYPGVRTGAPSLIYWPDGVEVIEARDSDISS
ncbi:MAG: hypothetical protein Q9173_002599 [Seirophora scorigena]